MQNKEFQVQSLGSQQEKVLVLKGPITEHAVFPIQEVDGVERLVLDLESVSNINSAGIRLWLQWMNAVRLLNPNVVLSVRACPKSMVDQMNFIRDFVPKATIVESFFVPFYCETCDHSDRVLLVRGEHFDERAENPEKVRFPDKLACPTCQKPMEPDVMGNYFKFLRFIRGAD